MWIQSSDKFLNQQKTSEIFPKIQNRHHLKFSYLDPLYLSTMLDLSRVLSTVGALPHDLGIINLGHRNCNI